MQLLGKCLCWLVLAGLVGLSTGAHAAPEGTKLAPRTVAHSGQNGAATPVLLFVDSDDEDDDGVADRSHVVAHRASQEILWLDAAASGHRLRSIRGGAVRVLGDQAELTEQSSLRELAPQQHVGLQGLMPGVAQVELESGTFETHVYELMAFDTVRRRVDLVLSHASLSRTLPDSLRPTEERGGVETDALRWLMLGPESGMPEHISVISRAADGRPLDALENVMLRPEPCPPQTPPSFACRSSQFIRATIDGLDRLHPRARELSLHAEVGGRLVVFSSGLKAASIRVGGPRQTRLGPLERYRGRLRVRVLRTGLGGGVAVGSDPAQAVEILRGELAMANALWGQCGIQFGDALELDVTVVDPPPPHMFAVGCGLGLPATGGKLAFRAAGRSFELLTPAGVPPERVAQDMASQLRAGGLKVTLSPNPREAFAASASVDVLVRGSRGQYVPLETYPAERTPERSLQVCLGAVNLTDGLRHFTDADAAVGTLEERTLLKAVADDDPSTIDVLVLPYFVTVGRIGESFVDAKGLGVRNAIIIDRAGVRAGARSFALAHELGHVLLQMAGHPDDFGTDSPTSLMDADAADATIFGPRRVSLAECERAILQSGPDAPLPLLRLWPLTSRRENR